MRISKLLCLTLVTIAFVSQNSFSQQSKLYLSQFQPININKSFTLSATNLLRTYINMGSRYRVVIPENLDTLYNENMTSKGRKATAYGCDYILKGELNRLGETVIVTVNLYRVGDSTIVWSDLLKAANPDDLDKIYERIAVNLGTDKKASKETDIYTVTEYQSKELNKERPNVSAGVGLGGMAVNVPFSVKSVPAGVSGIVFYDARSFLADLSGDLYFGDKSFSYMALNILCNYAFQKKKSTPYVGGGLSLNRMSYTAPVSVSNGSLYPFTENQNKSNGGMGVVINGGYIFNRTGTFKIRTGAKVILPTYTVDDRYLVGILFHVDMLFGN